MERELSDVVDETWIDGAGNVVGMVRGKTGAKSEGRPVVRVTAHMEELSMMVKTVNEDGTLHVTPLGMMYPGNFGLGPVMLLGDYETLPAVLTLGSEHTTRESLRIWQTKSNQGDRALDWRHVYVFTGRSSQRLQDAGIHAGTRVCVERSKRTLTDVGDYVGCYFLDDRAALVVMIEAARAVTGDGGRPANDVFFVATTSEELGGIGATYASKRLPGDITVAIDVGPAEDEYATPLTANLIVAYGDDAAVYDRRIADRLVAVGSDAGLAPMAAVWGSYKSDSSHSKRTGHSPRAGLLCIPTLSTHGYEVTHKDASPAARCCCRNT